MHVGYKELGSPSEPGEIEVNGRQYSVGADHIEQWIEDETIRFNVTEFGALHGRKRYVLGRRHN